MRFPHEISCFCCIFSLWDFLMRVHAFCFIMGLWDFVFLSRYEISLWDFMLICHCDSRRFSRGFGLVEWCNRGFFHLLFLRVDCECNRPSFGSCLIRVTSMHDIKSIRMFEDDVTWLEHALVIEGGFLGVWVSGMMYIIWRMCVFFGLSQYSDPGFFRLLFLRIACDCNRPSFSCDSVSICQCLQRWPQSVGRRECYQYGCK